MPITPSSSDRVCVEDARRPRAVFCSCFVAGRRLGGALIAALIVMATMSAQTPVPGTSVPKAEAERMAQWGFTQPAPLDFNDHTGYVSLFDGRTLKGWEGHPKFWRVENGAIIGQSTSSNPSGNQYLVYRATLAHDFTLKFEIKVEGDGGSGFQYRSKEGLKWRWPIDAKVAANTGPVNLNWMQTGPQADFWPSEIFSGQFYTENSPMGIMAYRGQLVEGAGTGPRRIMGQIADFRALAPVARADEWNQYTVIARGPVLIHILNGQVMSVMIDDDPKSANNWRGHFGIELEGYAKVSVRNIWLRKLD